jgi:hypothetical protein
MGAPWICPGTRQNRSSSASSGVPRAGPPSPWLGRRPELPQRSAPLALLPQRGTPEDGGSGPPPRPRSRHVVRTPCPGGSLRRRWRLVAGSRSYPIRRANSQQLGQDPRDMDAGRLGVMNSSSPICRFDLPAAASSRTSSSRRIGPSERAAEGPIGLGRPCLLRRRLEPQSAALRQQLQLEQARGDRRRAGGLTPGGPLDGPHQVGPGWPPWSHSP